MRRSWMALLLLLLGACTGPVRSTSVYESKAGATAETVASAVETARLAVDAAGQDKAFGRYLAEVLAEAEEAGAAPRGPSDPTQPPAGRADELRDHLDELLSRASDTLTELRIAARRGGTAELAGPAAALAQRAHR